MYEFGVVIGTIFVGVMVFPLPQQMEFEGYKDVFVIYLRRSLEIIRSVQKLTKISTDVLRSKNMQKDESDVDYKWIF